MAMPDVIYPGETEFSTGWYARPVSSWKQPYYSAAAVERMLREAFDTYCESVCVDHTEAIKHLMREQREGT